MDDYYKKCIKDLSEEIFNLKVETDRTKTIVNKNMEILKKGVVGCTLWAKILFGCFLYLILYK